ncbi:hypothetical protein D3C75_834780 [compost metagenome]
MEVGTRATILGIPGHGDPVAFLAARVDHLGRRRRPRPVTEAGELDATNVLQRQVGDVDVEHGARRQGQARLRLDQAAGDMGRGWQVVRLARQQRKRQRGTAKETAFQRGRDRARIEHVVAQVGTEVDPRHHHVRRLWQQPIEPQVHAVGRRAVEADEAIGQGLRMQWPVQRQRTAGAALVLIRGDHRALGIIRQRSVQRGDAGCGNTVVVRNQNTHGLSVCPADTRSTTSRTTTVAKHPAGRTNSSCRISGSG